MALRERPPQVRLRVDSVVSLRFSPQSARPSLPSFLSDVCPVSSRRMSCFDQTYVLFRSDVFPVSDVCPFSSRRVSCFDQTYVLFRSDVGEERLIRAP